MKKSMILIAFLMIVVTAIAQNEDTPSRYIDVTGSAEMEVAPDEIHFVIGIKEYWKEEYDKKTEFKDYRTKVPIKGIEQELIAKLAEINIDKDELVVQQAGNYWRHHGKDFLISKQILLKLDDFKKVNQVINKLNMRGIDYMRIEALKNSQITEFRKQVKIQALKAAKDKATYLVESLDQELGEVISITELNAGDHYWGPQARTSNLMMAAESGDSGIDNLKKIKLRYEIRARFEIK